MFGYSNRRGSKARNRTVVALVLLRCVALTVSSAQAQTWTLDPASTSVVLDTEVAIICVIPCGPLFGPTTVLTPGLQGADVTYFSGALCDPGATAPCGCKASSWARIDLRGLATSTLRIRAEGYAYVKHRCDHPQPYSTYAIGDIELSTLGFMLTGLAPGAPATIFYRGDGFAFGSHDPEAGGDDWTVVGLPATSIAINGAAVLPAGGLDLPFVKGAITDSWSGSVGAIDGVPTTVNLSGGTWAVINPPPKVVAGAGQPQQYYEYDPEYCGFVYNLALRINRQIPPDDVCPPSTFEFSLDIGSDTERSDTPPMDGNEVFEPFDTYLSSMIPIPFPGADGVRTDDMALGVDFSPAVPGGPGAPTCIGAALMPATTSMLDLDGTDSLDFSLSALIALSPQTPTGALQFPILAFPSPCVHGIENLFISYEDDTAEHFVGAPGVCGVPVASGSPIGQTYGSAARDDEILGVRVFTTFVGRTAIQYPVADEASVHISMAPDPPFTPPMGPLPPQTLDDDVDALDMVAATGSCSTWLFGVDHEARAGFPVPAPNWIYQWSPGGGPPALTIIGSVHLGVSASADIRDFELVRMPDPSGLGGPEVLALLFSVSPDDPLTIGIDESGGLLPSMIYGSYLTGAYFTLLEDTLDDAIDALAAWCDPLADPAPSPPCPADIAPPPAGNGFVNVDDLLAVINAWGPCPPPCPPSCAADIAPPGGNCFVNVDDLLAVINAWGPCP